MGLRMETSLGTEDGLLFHHVSLWKWVEGGDSNVGLRAETRRMQTHTHT